MRRIRLKPDTTYANPFRVSASVGPWVSVPCGIGVTREVGFRIPDPGSPIAIIS